MWLRRPLLVLLFAMLFAPLAQAQPRFEGGTFYFANRTYFTIECYAIVNGDVRPWRYIFRPNDELWFNLSPRETLQMRCPDVSDGALIEGLSPMRRYLFLRRRDMFGRGEVALFDVTLDIDAARSQ